MAIKRLSKAEIDRLRVIKYQAENSFLFFCMYMFKEHTGDNFIPFPHVVKIANALEKVVSGETKRLIINIPPRYGKTLLAVKMFITWGLALNPKAKFIHLSYSSELALDNSAEAKEYIQSEHFQKIWSMKLKFDAQGKQKWFNEQSGGCYATSTGGSITGFGAGTMKMRDNKEDDNKFIGFGGAIVIDDPNKPDDAFSDIKRTFVNTRFNNTIKSRVNSRETPIVVIQQRLHEADLSGFLLNGGSAEEWEHLNLPALNEQNEPLCASKHTLEELESIKQADPYTFNGQYLQSPTPGDGGMWVKDWFKIKLKAEIPTINSWQLYIDGAYTKNTKNDPTGLMICARHENELYVLSAISKYMEMPELLKYIPQYINSLGVYIDSILIEPKASGLSMAQLLRNQTSYNVIELRGNILRESKIERASKSSPYIESGKVNLVKDTWNDGFLEQISRFPLGRHDEYVDLLSYAIDRDLFKKSSMRIVW